MAVGSADPAVILFSQPRVLRPGTAVGHPGLGRVGLGADPHSAWRLAAAPHPAGLDRRLLPLARVWVYQRHALPAADLSDPGTLCILGILGSMGTRSQHKSPKAAADELGGGRGGGLRAPGHPGLRGCLCRQLRAAVHPPRGFILDLPKYSCSGQSGAERWQAGSGPLSWSAGTGLQRSDGCVFQEPFRW